jgi:hypothetical protein
MRLMEPIGQNPKARSLKTRQHMKKAIYLLILPLLAVSGFVFASRDGKSDGAETKANKSCTVAAGKTAREVWEASPDGLRYMEWTRSPVGGKVLSDAVKLKPYTSTFTDMEAVITSLTLPLGSRLGFGVMARINGEDYILSFGSVNSDEFKRLQSLAVNDKIIIRSHTVSLAPKYSFAIVNVDYVERDRRILYKRAPRKDGC